MASKDASAASHHTLSRPLVHRLSVSAAANAAVPSAASAVSSSSGSRQAHARTHSHSVLMGPTTGNSRVSRRKSMTTSTATHGANMAAVAAALGSSYKEGSDKVMPLPIAGGGRRTTSAAARAARASAASVLGTSLPSPPASLPSSKFVSSEAQREMMQGSAIDDSNDLSGEEPYADFQKNRTRRASDGQSLVKEGRKFNRVELRCDKCGKSYKHSSCLTKHLWEHTPEWSYTSKLLISKHQQVQLLEAASVLVAMNNTPAAEETTTPPDSARDFTSDHESVSPAASGYSDQQDPGSSADTTPPPQSEVFNVPGASYRSASKRHSSGSGFSRSYQSTHSLVPASLPNEPYSLGHSRHVSYERGPSSGGQDDKDLAAAVELLSCSLGSSNGAAVTSHMVSLSDAPPVPPLPARYLDQATTPFLIGSFPANAPESFTRGDARRRAAAATAAERDVKMEEGTETSSVMEDDDDGDDMRSRARSDEDDDGVFGRMDE